MWAYFLRFRLKLTRQQAALACHQGRCDEDVARVAAIPAVARQLRNIDDETLRAELRETGGWDDNELHDRQTNVHRIVWIAAGSINEETAVSRHGPGGRGY